MSDQEFINAIQRGDIERLIALLDTHPEMLGRQIDSWPGPTTRYGGGGLLHCAVTWNQPKIIAFLVRDRQLSPNLCFGTWKPLDYAAHAGAYDAAAMLLQLGADPEKSYNGDTKDFCRSTKMEAAKQALDPAYLAKLRQKKIAGTWARTTPQEIVHDYELPEQKYRLTDIFNFEMRFWQRATQDQRNNGIANNITFFDDMPDKTILHQAAEKLRELGGEVDDSAIDYQPVRGKQPRPKS